MILFFSYYNKGMLIEFYGLECSHCIKMAPLVSKLEEETGVKIEKFETWHNADNNEKREEYDKGFCGGVPLFYNTETKDFICGEASYEELKKWVTGTPA